MDLGAIWTLTVSRPIRDQPLESRAAEFARGNDWEARVRPLIFLFALLLCAPAAGRAQAACPTPWRLEEVLRIGSVESTDLITGVLDLAMGPDSALYVTQAMVPAVTVYSLDGRVLRRIGRAGQGPGDFQLAAISVGWIGDTLWVADLNRVQLFHTDERVPEEVIQFSRSVPEEGSRLSPGRMLADGTLIGMRVTTDGRVLSSRGDNPGLALRRLSRSGEVLDTIAIMDWSGNAVENERDAQLFPGQHPLKDRPLIGLKEPLTALKPDGSAIVQIGKVHEGATQPAFDLLVISIHGDTLLHRSVQYEPREVTRAMERRLADEYAGWRAGDYAMSGSRQLTEATLERRRRAARRVFWVPEYHPPVREIVAGRDGTIWLLREMREDRIDVWEIYDSDGTLTGAVEVPEEVGHRHSNQKPWTPPLSIALASRDEVWGATFDENDVPYITRYRVDRTCPP